MRRTIARLSPTASRVRNLTIGIRREDPARLWERRCPLTPDAVKELVEDVGVNVLVQPCERRVFRAEEFVKAGATLQHNLEPASIVMGIKEVPLNELVTAPPSTLKDRRRTHLMFSHTAKGQSYNLPLLSRFLNEDGARLIDYELIMGEGGKRAVGFGWFAGVAGVVEGLCASAHDALRLGIASPFLHLPRPYSNRTLADMRSSLRSVGNYIAEHGMPEASGPFVIGVTGNGNVSTGALDMLKELPLVHINVEQLEAIIRDKNTDLRKVYVVHIPPASYLFDYNNNPYDRSAYYTRPSSFHSIFHSKVAPYLSLLINGVGWKPGSPRLMSSEQLRIARRKAREIGIGRFRTIADVTCDIEGGLEFVTRSTTISDPFYYTNPTPGERDGIQIMSIDILPTELPFDSSMSFSQALMPYLRGLISEYRSEPSSKFQKEKEALERATIAWDGKLVGPHQWLYEPLRDLGKETKEKGPETVGVRRKKRILMLGSGMVAGPAAAQFLQRSDVELVVASNDLKEAEKLVRDSNGRGRATTVDVFDARKLGELVKGADVVVSLLPAGLHPTVAEHCLKHHKHLVTASYISPAMRALHERALEADVILLNELGLDPGLDHMSAVSMRKKIEATGRKVVGFKSWCGGLPAPENSDVPFGMKFSWSPRGLLSAALNDARFKLNSKIHTVPGSKLLSSYFSDIRVAGARGFNLEGLANRDSFGYAELYGLGDVDGLEDLFRGTLRYKGFSALLDAFRILGFLDSTPLRGLSHWSDFLAAVLGSKSKDWDSLRSQVNNKLNNWDGDSNEFWETLKCLSLTPDTYHNSLVTSLPSIPKESTALDLFTSLLSHKLRYGPGERDMVILSHEMTSVPLTPTYSLTRAASTVHTSTMVTYSDAMARTVGLPIAFGALRVLDGLVKERGVKMPVDEEVYEGVLSELERVGIKIGERTMESGFLCRL